MVTGTGETGFNPIKTNFRVSRSVVDASIASRCHLLVGRTQTPLLHAKRGRIIETKHRFHVRFNDRQWAKLIKNSANAGLSKAEYIRKLVDGKDIKPKPPETYKQLVYEISAIGNNVNQIAHQANAMSHATKEQADNAVLLVNKCIELIREMR